jgi:hypothetical protein
MEQREARERRRRVTRRVRRIVPRGFDELEEDDREIVIGGDDKPPAP